MDETDLFFNLRLGEIILGTRHVPTENLLSFTYPRATDINLAWLFQILLAQVHRLGSLLCGGLADGQRSDRHCCR